MPNFTEIVKQLRALADQLEGATDENNPYRGGYAFEFTKTYNGNLYPGELEQMRAEWIAEIDRIRPFTKEMHEQRLAAGERDPYPRFWISVGGLKVEQKSQIREAFRRIREKWSDLAADRAKQARAAAGWTGRDYLTSPSGKQTGPGGYGFGRYTLPGDSD